MEGGIAILLLLIIVAAAAVIGAIMYFTGGALWLSKSGERRGSGRFERPEHKQVTSETIENTRLVGARKEDVSDVGEPREEDVSDISKP
jgi:membrane protein DedA with SNARE-associated domain